MEAQNTLVAAPMAQARQAVPESYAAVVATCDREDSLSQVLGDWSAQTAKPQKVVVVRAGESTETGISKSLVEVEGRDAVLGETTYFDRGHLDNLEKSGISLVELWADERSAAKQRNLGAQDVETEWIVFCDDDVRFGPELAEKTIAFIRKHPEAVAVFPRMRGSGHPVPGKCLRAYYRMQAGFDDETYGAKLFGAGLSCYPCWERQASPVETNWLPSTMLWVKTDVFKRHEFPDFEGYSFGEDAYLTHRIWREATRGGGKIYFLAEPKFEHRSIQSGVKAHRFALGRMTIRNQKRIAREAMGKPALEVFLKSLLHRCFVTIALLKSRRPGWLEEIAGVWSA